MVSNYECFFMLVCDDFELVIFFSLLGITLAVSEIIRNKELIFAILKMLRFLNWNNESTVFIYLESQNLKCSWQQNLS